MGTNIFICLRTADIIYEGKTLLLAEQYLLLLALL